MTTMARDLLAGLRCVWTVVLGESNEVRLTSNFPHFNKEVVASSIAGTVFFMRCIMW